MLLPLSSDLLVSRISVRIVLRSTKQLNALTCSHMHIHITAANNVMQPGALVGKAHQLEEVIDLLELGVDFKGRTLRYQLGERSELWDVLSATQASSASI